ncbi:MAG: hypothetical protein U1F43_22885 [Myxococcota bacterium]
MRQVEHEPAAAERVGHGVVDDAGAGRRDVGERGRGVAREVEGGQRDGDVRVVDGRVGADGAVALPADDGARWDEGGRGGAGEVDDVARGLHEAAAGVERDRAGGRVLEGDLERAGGVEVEQVADRIDGGVEDAGGLGGDDAEPARRRVGGEAGPGLGAGAEREVARAGQHGARVEAGRVGRQRVDAEAVVAALGVGAIDDGAARALRPTTFRSSARRTSAPSVMTGPTWAWARSSGARRQAPGPWAMSQTQRGSGLDQISRRGPPTSKATGVAASVVGSRMTRPSRVVVTSFEPSALACSHLSQVSGRLRFSTSATGPLAVVSPSAASVATVASPEAASASGVTSAWVAVVGW